MASWLLAPGLLLLGASIGHVAAGGPELNSNYPAASAFSLSRASAADPISLASSPWTPRHAPGTCALRGHCGKSGFFGPELPCVDNDRAAKVGSDSGLTDDGKERLIKLCGEEWRDVIDNKGSCCNDGQIDALTSNLQRAEQIIGSCPACRKNFFSVFCSFTCSPDQSVFVNVTDAKLLGREKTEAVQSITIALSEDFGRDLYDSCKDVRFGSGMKAIDLIGGGAKNHREMLAFIGKKRLGGSPFEMVFVENATAPMEVLKMDAKHCDGDEEEYRCSCADCKGMCPTLPDVARDQCRVGVLPCLTFGVIIVYGVLVLVVTGVLAVTGKRRQRGAPMFLDDTDEDDEDEGTTYNGGYGFGYRAGYTDEDAISQEYPLNTMLERFFNRLGLFCADFPATTIGVSLLLALVCSAGWAWAKIETDPVKLWVAPDSAAAVERAYFDNHMGPQIRPEQLIAVNETGPILSRETLEWWIGVEERVGRLRGLFHRDGVNHAVGWEDICLKPAGGCVVQSVGGYFRDRSLRDWPDRVRDCVAVPVDCLVDGMPVDGSLVLGHRGKKDPNHDVLDSQAMFLTWVVDGNKGEAEIEAWEDVLLPVLKAVEAEGKARGLSVSYSTGQSLEHELGRTAGSDGRVVVASYVVMLLYVVTMLSAGAFWTDSFATAVLHSKVGVSIAGIGVVVLSVAAAGGIVTILGFSVTLIIAEVIPFLVLAVGVDNVFLLVHAVDQATKHNAEGRVSHWVSHALARTGPGITLAASAEVGLFALGAAVGMPAVRNFAVYAAVAVLVNALLQLTLFVAVLSLDLRRVKNNRADCVPCAQVVVSVALPGEEREGRVAQFVQEVYAPFVVGYRYVILAVATTMFALCLGLFVPKVQLGLDQRLALPTDSHLVSYFDDIANYLQVGPPVFFVVQDVDATERDGQRVLCGQMAGCDGTSVPTILGLEAQRPEVSHLTGGVAGWEDDFLRWLDPSVGCCTDKRGEPCWPEYNRKLSGMPEGEEFAELVHRWLNVIPDGDCPLGGAAYGDSIVFEPKASTAISAADDLKLAPYSNETIVASHFRTAHTPLRTQSDFIAAYKSARRIAADLSSQLGATVFPYSEFYVFFHQYLSIIPLASNLLLSAGAVVFLLVTLFTGSLGTGAVVTAVVSSIVVHVIAAMAIFGISLNAVSLVNLLICAGLAVEFCAHVARAYAIPDVEVLTRVPFDGPGHGWGKFGSVFGLLSSIVRVGRSRTATAGSFGRTGPGAGTHTGSGGALGSGPGGASGSASPFANQASKPRRAIGALMDVGPAVVEGIGLTKVLGVSVLAFAHSKIFDVYYFRVWAVLVAVSLVHALVVLPAGLAVWGGRAWRGGAGPSDRMNEYWDRAYGRAGAGDPDEDDEDETSFGPEA